jgi:xeroderma pigmentosum group C-complementing protein
MTTSRKQQAARQTPAGMRRSTRRSTRVNDDASETRHETLADIVGGIGEEQMGKSGPARSARSRKPALRQRTSARGRQQHHGIDPVYSEMVAEAVAQENATVSRATKRRKISEEPTGQIELDFDLFGGSTEMDENQASTLQQVTLTEYDTASESEADFEDVDLEPNVEEPDYEDRPEQTPLELDLSTTTTPRRSAPKRKPVTAAERLLRLSVHKAHIVMLLAHLKCRNQWCESGSVQAILKPFIPRKITSLLHVDDQKTQYERNQSFMKGIEQVCLIWKSSWTVTTQGMRRAFWREDVDAVKDSDDAEDLEFDDFETAAVSKRGSRDLAAQLFCALLRSIAVDTRLVCSLQVLPFSRVAKGQTPQKPTPTYVYAPPQNYNSSNELPQRKKRSFEESRFPIFWVEVFAPATQTWIPLDPIVRHTVNKPKTGFEPPANDAYNRMTYVVAFEDDGSARDVTRRYTQFFNSKIRKHRVEGTTGGEKWWDKIMRLLEKPFREPRDDIEDAFLQKRAESEPMPNNIEDFKGHSIYVLERHLRKNEVIHPKREVGKVSIGAAKNAKLVDVFRRRDVHTCRTADAWYRRGRDVNEGEQPLKRGVAKQKQATDNFDDDEEAAEGTALYAEFQTSIYEPPPVVEGKVPRNAFGNLDVYVPSMIPPGAVHIRHPLAAKAARILGVDFAEAVTGFQFKGRQGTAVLDGVVVSLNMTNAMVSVIEGLEWQASEEAQEARSKIVVALWKRWLAALRIKDHVKREYGDREMDTRDGEDEDGTFRPEEDGGGFMLDPEEIDKSDDNEDPPMPGPAQVPDLRPLELPVEMDYQEIVVIRSPHKLPEMPSRITQKQDLIPEGRFPSTHGINVNDAEAEGGGFIIDEGAEEPAGGFLIEEGGGKRSVTDEEAGDGGGFIPDTDGQDLEATQKNPTPLPLMSGALAPEDEHLSHGRASADETTSGNQVREEAAQKIWVSSPDSAQTPTSLLSHDPEEDDAEPEWLLNSLGEID